MISFKTKPFLVYEILWTFEFGTFAFQLEIKSIWGSDSVCDLYNSARAFFSPIMILFILKVELVLWRHWWLHQSGKVCVIYTLISLYMVSFKSITFLVYEIWMFKVWNFNFRFQPKVYVTLRDTCMWFV